MALPEALFIPLSERAQKELNKYEQLAKSPEAEYGTDLVIGMWAENRKIPMPVTIHVSPNSEYDPLAGITMDYDDVKGLFSLKYERYENNLFDISTGDPLSEIQKSLNPTSEKEAFDMLNKFGIDADYHYYIEDEYDEEGNWEGRTEDFWYEGSNLDLIPEGLHTQGIKKGAEWIIGDESSDDMRALSEFAWDDTLENGTHDEQGVQHSLDSWLGNATEGNAAVQTENELDEHDINTNDGQEQDEI